MTDGGCGRRDYLAALGMVATVGLAGCTDDSTRRPEWPGYVSDASDQGYADVRGEDEITITVDNNNFDPTFVWVDPGTTITWEFEDAGHTVDFTKQPADAGVSGTPGGDFDVVEEGGTHTVTPETEGLYTYHCVPHEGMGMKGAIAVGDDIPTVPAEDDTRGQPAWPEYVSDANGGYYSYARADSARGDNEVTITVRSNFYTPTFVWVDPGTTITWEFEAPGHTVKFNEQPADAEVSGTPGGEFDVVDEGETHSVTPEIGGIYTYHCGPHEGMGMKGAIAVGDLE